MRNYNPRTWDNALDGSISFGSANFLGTGEGRIRPALEEAQGMRRKRAASIVWIGLLLGMKRGGGGAQPSARRGTLFHILISLFLCRRYRKPFHSLDELRVFVGAWALGGVEGWLGLALVSF